MGRRRRRLTEGNALIDELASKCKTLMDNRMRILNPFPVQCIKLYEQLWESQEDRLDMERYMDKYPTSFEGRSSFRVEVNETYPLRDIDMSEFEYADAYAKHVFDFRVHHMTVKLDRNYPLFETDCGWRPSNIKIPMERFAAEDRDAVSAWMGREIVLSFQRDQLTRKLFDLGRFTNTVGQMFRVWPDVVNLYPPDVHSKVTTAKAKSKLTGAYDQELWTPKVMQQYNGWIAEALLFDAAPDDSFRPKIFGEIRKGHRSFVTGAEAGFSSWLEVKNH